MADRYKIEDRVGRVLFRGTLDECIGFMKRVSDCRGPYREGARG